MSFCRLCLRYMLYFFFVLFVFFVKQNTEYDMRISDWSSDVCSSELHRAATDNRDPCHRPPTSTKSQRCGNADNEQENRKDDISKRQAVPSGMSEDRGPRGRLKVDKQHQHHICSPQEIERQVADARRLSHGARRSEPTHGVRQLRDIGPFHSYPSAAIALANIPP